MLDLSSPSLVLTSVVILSLISISIPFWWKPSGKERLEISEVDVDACGGCTQCVSDCPYEAISMRPHPNGKHLLAEVSEPYCVSCGICAASCDDLAIGPPERTSQDHLDRMNEFCSETLEEGNLTDVVVVACLHNDSTPDFLENYSEDHQNVHYFGLNCCATLHSTALETLLSHCGGVVLVGCAARNCMNRDALTVLSGRIYGKRVPFLARDIDRSRILVSPHSESETDEIEADIQKLLGHLKGKGDVEEKHGTSLGTLFWCIKRTVATTVLVGLIALISQTPMGQKADFALLRVVSRLPSQAKLDCRPAVAEDLSDLPLHMRQKDVCQEHRLSYILEVKIDGRQLLKQQLAAKGLRGEIPIFLEREFRVEPGKHEVAIEINASGDNLSSKVASRQYREIRSFQTGEIILVKM